MCGIKIPRGTKAKQVVLNFVIETEKDFVVEYTRHGNPKPNTYDRADSYVVAKAAFLGYRRFLNFLENFLVILIILVRNTCSTARSVSITRERCQSTLKSMPSSAGFATMVLKAFTD